MPLLPAYYTTTRYSRRKKKVNPQKYETEWRKHNKFLKRMQLSPLTLQEYIDSCRGTDSYTHLTQPTILLV